MQQITERILKKIKPQPVETKKFQRITAQFLKKLNSQLKSQAKAILGGSGAKDTWLSGSHDIDIFVQFDYKKYNDSSSTLADILEEKLKKISPKLKRLHGSRDYFQTIHQGYLFEIVPILKISQSSQSINITDISPLHAQWVKKSPKKLRNEIRLTKQFAKASNCYGAESYISGFSGYVLEIMTIYYGSFEKFLQAALKWESKDVIDVNKYYIKNEVFKKINASKLHSPLIVVDPVDKTRNAAAALSIEKFLLFKKKVREFTKNPALKSFEKEKLSFKNLEKQTLHNLVYLEASPLTGKEDVVGNKLLKTFQHLKKKLMYFKIREANWDWDRKNKAIFYFILEKRQIPPFFVRAGPPLKLEKYVEEFKKKHKDTFEERNRVMAKIPLKHFLIKDFVNEILKDDYVKERIKGIKIIKFG
jgi:tRNA nucleotidyltransferase (CCA-adding enzyme)